MFGAGLWAIVKGRMGDQPKGELVRRSREQASVYKPNTVTGFDHVLARCGDVFLIVGGQRHAGFGPVRIAPVVDLVKRDFVAGAGNFWLSGARQDTAEHEHHGQPEHRP